MRKCGVHSVNMANVKACFAMQNLNFESEFPPDRFTKIYCSDSVTMETPRAFAVLRRDVGYAMQFAARSILYVDYKPCKQGCK